MHVYSIPQVTGLFYLILFSMLIRPGHCGNSKTLKGPGIEPRSSLLRARIVQDLGESLFPLARGPGEETLVGEGLVLGAADEL